MERTSQLAPRADQDAPRVGARADDIVKPYPPRLPWTDRAAIVQGYAGVYSSFLLHAERAEHAEQRYGVQVCDILDRVAQAGYVGGQEDMLVNVALELARERQEAAKGHDQAS